MLCLGCCSDPNPHFDPQRVDQKVKLVPGRYPEDACVHRQFPENPLDSLTPLTPLPPDFIPTKKLTKERLALMKLNPDGFLWPEEENFFAHVMKLNEVALAFDESERGNFCSDYFSPYIILVLPHEPWEYRNIPIPPGICHIHTFPSHNSGLTLARLTSP